MCEYVPTGHTPENEYSEGVKKCNSITSGSQKCQEYIGTFCWFEFTLIPTLVVPLVTYYYLLLQHSMIPLN